ncbi:hypothetical protein [Planosporangium flavigriseum]|nr:hypothetical protein [Planosporangium flavigriseum]
MAPVDSREIGLDPAEMTSPCSVRVTPAGDEIVVEMVRVPDRRLS